MSVSNSKDNKYCLFWSMEFKKCKICNTGLFIPLEDHIDVFCKTSRYPQCLQYSLNQGHSEDTLNVGNQDGSNRRNHMRVESRNQITLVKLIQSDKIVNHVSTAAETLDISRGGMRLTTNSPVPQDTVIQFAFDKVFPSSFHRAMGQVEWCNKQIDEPGYQVGVSFQEERIVRAMDHYLGANYGTS